ncbi:hypothetical protein JAAARDRAFT_179795 [Jaapia argillacea MUCL 33604]|uniref:Major facilitator superfamily (MFS) profile domain-containing protein n=1 Tax=Jaapia argillacea MUCL 33604 TaxID=933084 RepID=A0A067PYF5_9AGAM|nr:hypothetical protein JAAARDRAFT_179795 [Jaapia argillacea MUCL 33604]
MAHPGLSSRAPLVDEDDSDSQPLLTRYLYPRPHPHPISNPNPTFTLQPDRSYTYTYGPPSLFANNYVFLCALFASIGGLTFGYDQGVIANVLVMKDFVGRWGKGEEGIGPWEVGVLTAALELGCLIGALLSGYLADKYSRRRAIFLACVVFLVGSTLQTFAMSLNQLTLGRAIGGLGVGGLSTLSPLYMTEISPPETRGSLLSLEQFSIVLGCVVGFWVGFGTRNIPGALSWRLPLSLQLLPGILLAIGCFWLPPSPRWLVGQGRIRDAEKSLGRLRLVGERRAEGLVDGLVKLELLEMQVEATLLHRTSHSPSESYQQLVSNEGDVDSGKPSNHGVKAEWRAWKRLLEWKYRDRTWVGVLMMFFQQWSGINAFLYYGPTLISSLGLPSSDATLIVSGGIGIVQFFAVFPAIAMIDRLGRKPLLRTGSVMMSLSHLVIALVVYQFSNDWSSHQSAAWIAVAFVYIFTASYGVSYGPIAWCLITEVFPLSMRSKGVSLSTASNWTNNFLIGLVTPALMQTSPAGTFLTFSVACFVGYIWSTYVVPETANVSLEEIDKLFRSSAGREDQEIKFQIEEELGLHELVRELEGMDAPSTPA